MSSECEIIVDSEGKEIVVGPDGEQHALGLMPDPHPPRLRTIGQSGVEIPSREKLIDLVESDEYQRNVGGAAHYDSSITKNQNGWGKCASSCATYLLEKARHRSGQPRIELSDDYLYSLVNGNRDAGGTLSENWDALTQRGVATRETVKEGQIYRNKYDTKKADKEALRFRAHEGFATPSEQEAIVALLGGKCVGIAIHVGRNWKRFDADGVLVGDRGPGNHSEHLDHVRYNRQKGRFEFREHSSHGKSQGDGGFFWVVWDIHLATVHPSHTFYSIPVATQDPFGLSPINDGGSDSDDNKPEPITTARVVVTSSEFCHWCKRWNDRDRPILQSAGVAIAAGDVAGSGVPRFRLEVGEQMVEKVGYWEADAILKQIADLKMAAYYGD